MKDKSLNNSSKQKKLISTGSFYAWPMGIWFFIFFIAPLVIIFVYSFLTKGVYGGVEPKFTLKAYKDMFNPKYGLIVLRTLKITIISTAITILIALPCAYAMARSKYQTLFLFLVIIPFWTNSLIRIFAWMSILNNDGILNQLLMKLHVIKEYLPFLYNQNAVILVSVYMYIPYAILPIFTAVDRFDFSLIEAARDLGATKTQSMIKILIPGIKSGIISALIFTFIPIFGAYTVPLLVGGKDSYMLGNIIVDQVQKTRNWPLAAAFSLVITIISVVGIVWITKSNEQDQKSKKKVTKEDNYVGGIK
ncbi:MAG: ABC transporter permease [Treponema sp.]|jgi:spermidine/putrescine transport system permease protein|nr:ABC transporter permease [Treponema bryantii]MBO5826092.1 ABC transporter permease [Treponema sp.]MBQ7970327.1 ABC transporter permease [Treponema sp.]